MNQQQKLKYVAQSLGLKTLTQMQGSTRNVFDTIVNPNAATSLTFFKNVGQRNFPDTNVSDNKFQVNEALLIEAISVYKVAADTGALSAIDGRAVADVIIGNSITYTDIPLAVITAQSNMDKGAANQVFYSAPLIGIVIPPQVEFEIRINFESAQGLPASFPRIGCNIYGTAALLNLQKSL
jgi:hypothetical protein